VRQQRAHDVKAPGEVWDRTSRDVNRAGYAAHAVTEPAAPARGAPGVRSLFISHIMAFSGPMILCPDCRSPVPSLNVDACENCDWRAELSGDVPIFLSSADRQSPLFSNYLANYDRIAADDLSESIQHDSFLELQAEQLHRHLGDVRGLSVCDVGIGQGVLFRRLRDSGPRLLTGVDISMAYLARHEALGDVRVLMANAENLPFRDEFDLVIASDVAEHVLNISDLLMSVREALVPGGVFAIRVPFKDNMVQYARLDGCKYDMVHLRNFAKDNLVDLLCHFDLSVESLHYDGFAPYRVRSPLVSTSLGRSVTNAVMERLPSGPDGFLRINPHLGRLLTTPVAITAIARKNGG
jgi:SAM-dependent methyltransferase